MYRYLKDAKVSGLVYSFDFGVKLIFSIPDIPDVKYEVAGKNKYSQFASRFWNKTKEISKKSTDKIKTHQYQLTLEKFVFNGKEEYVK